MKRICTALFTVMRLSVKQCLIILVSVFMLLLFAPFILAYIIAVPIMILSPIILMVMGFVNGFHTIGTGEIIEVLKGVVLGSFLAIIGYYIGKSAVKRLTESLKWNISIYKRERMI